MRWWCIGVVLLVGSAWAQEGSKPLSDAERAKRDAEKVFSFIKFQTVKKAPAAAPAPVRTAPASAPAPQRAEAPKAEPARVEPAPARVMDAALPQPAPVVEALPTVVPPLSTAPVSTAPVSTAPLTAASAPTPVTPADEVDEADEVELKLLEFVAPELPAAVQATLGASNPRVKLRFQVGADGKVLSVRAADGVPRRIAQVAERAVAQWRFEPIASARDVEVEIAFRRE